VKRIKEAAKQLRDNLKKASPGSRGVIAVSFSKILNPGDKLLVMKDAAQGRERLERALEKNRAEKYRHAWEKYYGTEIVGIMFHIITPAVHTEENKWFVCQQLDVHPLSGVKSPGYQVFRKLGAALEKVRY